MKEVPPRKIPLVFFRTAAGGEPVREWLKGLPEVERQVIGKDLLRAQWRWPVGMPLCRPLGGGLWKIRTDFADEKDLARAAVRAPRSSGGVARIHQEDPQNSG